MRRALQAAIVGAVSLLVGCGGGSGPGSTIGGGGGNHAASGGPATIGQVIGGRTTPEKPSAAAPTDAAGWAALADARFLLATSPTNFDQTTATFTAAGKLLLPPVKEAWDRYLALKPKPPSARIAAELVEVLGPSGLSQLPEAVGAQEVVASENASPAELGRLAVLAYLARQTRKGDLAAAKAVSLAPKSQRPVLERGLAAAKSQAKIQAQLQATAQAQAHGQAVGAP